MVEHNTLPERLAGLKITGLIASGGFASVYLAEDEKGGRLAVKQLHPEMRSRPGLVEGFAREARFLVSRKLPGVVNAIHFEQKECALVMEFLDGHTMEEVIRGALGEINFRTRLLIGISLCETLQGIHSEGSLHLDLKPDNVFLTMDGRVVLLDFGVAATMAGSESGHGPVMGAINYMSPELLFQNTAPSARSDLYSLGVMLYEFFSGRKPYSIDKATRLKSALERVWPLDRLEDVKLSPGTGLAVQRCLAWDPNRRWRSASELAEMLKKEMPPGTSTGGVAEVMGRVRKVLRRRPPSNPQRIPPISPVQAPAPRDGSGRGAGLLIGLGVLLLAVFAGAILYFVGIPGRRNAPPDAVPSAAARPDRAGRTPRAEPPPPTPVPAAPTPTPVPTATPLALPSGHGDLVLKSSPAGARVLSLLRSEDGRDYVDRLTRTQVPLKVSSLPTGNYRIFMELNGSRISGRIRVLANQRVTLKLDFPASGNGELLD